MFHRRLHVVERAVAVTIERIVAEPVGGRVVVKRASGAVIRFRLIVVAPVALFLRRIYALGNRLTTQSADDGADGSAHRSSDRAGSHRSCSSAGGDTTGGSAKPDADRMCSRCTRDGIGIRIRVLAQVFRHVPLLWSQMECPEAASIVAMRADRDHRTTLQVDVVARLPDRTKPCADWSGGAAQPDAVPTRLCCALLVSTEAGRAASLQSVSSSPHRR